MALLGGGVGGAGNPVGGSFTGPAEALDIYGDFAVGYSGSIIAASGSDGTMFDFTSGNYLFVGRFQMAYDAAQLSTTETMGYTVTFNGSTVIEMSTELKEDRFAPQPLWQDVIIPPYTEVVCTAQTSDSSGAYTVTGIFSGRIYRTRN